MPDVGISVSPTIVSRLKEKGADAEARTIAEAIASLGKLAEKFEPETSDDVMSDDVSKA